MVYPDAENLERYIRLPGFKSFELCQQAAINVLRSQPDPDAGTYECGYMCGPSSDYPGMTICKETRD